MPCSRTCAGAAGRRRGSGDRAGGPRRRCRPRSRARPGSSRRRPRSCSRGRSGRRAGRRSGRRRRRRRRPAQPPRPARPATGRPTPGWLAADEIRMPAQPGSWATFSQPEMPRSISRADPVADVAIAQRRDAGVDAERRAARAAGRSPASWRRRCTGTGRPPRRGPRRGRPRAARPPRWPGPRPSREPHLRCETWSRAPGPAARTRRDRLVERVEQPVRLVAHVRRVQAAATGRRRPRASRPRRPTRASRARRSGRTTGRTRRRPAPPRPRRPSRPARRGRRRPALGADDRPADRAVTDEERDVRPEGLLLDPVEVLGEGAASAPRARSGAATARPARGPISVTGARLSPQLPDSWVVNPWWRWLASAPSTSTEPSEWPCGSMKPGDDHAPAASRTSATAVAVDRREVADRPRSGRRGRRRPPAGPARRCRRSRFRRAAGGRRRSFGRWCHVD